MQNPPDDLNLLISPNVFFAVRDGIALTTTGYLEIEIPGHLFFISVGFP